MPLSLSNTGHLSLEREKIHIHRVIEQAGTYFSRQEFFPQLSDDAYAANRDWLEPHHFEPGTQRPWLTMQSWLVRTPHHNILVDTCCGNDKERPTRLMWHRQKLDTYMAHLKAHGLGPDDIDCVMCTHLHGDHVGWNTMLDNGRWVPTFPKARYIMSKRELDYWTARHVTAPTSCGWIGDSVLPIVAAGQVETVASDHAVADHIHLVPTPGHTIDHFSVQVGTPNNDAFISGDMVHSPLQCRYPDLGMFSDYDAAQGAATRRAVFARYVDTPTVMCMAHFAAPSMGRLTRWGDGYRYVPLG